MEGSALICPFSFGSQLLPARALYRARDEKALALSRQIDAGAALALARMHRIMTQHPTTHVVPGAAVRSPLHELCVVLAAALLFSGTARSERCSLQHGFAQSTTFQPRVLAPWDSVSGFVSRMCGRSTGDDVRIFVSSGQQTRLLDPAVETDTRAPSRAYASPSQCLASLSLLWHTRAVCRVGRRKNSPNITWATSTFLQFQLFMPLCIHGKSSLREHHRPLQKNRNWSTGSMCTENDATAP